MVDHKRCHRSEANICKCRHASVLIAAVHIRVRLSYSEMGLWLTSSTPPEAVWTFDAALSMWAVIHFSSTPLALSLPSSSPSVTISWSETPKLETWIQTGGAAFVQGLGDVATLTPREVLQQMATRLETLSWGLAVQYRQILLNLLTEA